MIYFGEIKKFDAKRGFGFIVPNRHFSINKKIKKIVKQKDLFFYKNSIVSDGRIPFLKTGDKVSYEIGIGRNGEKIAEKVSLVG